MAEPTESSYMNKKCIKYIVQKEKKSLDLILETTKHTYIVFICQENKCRSPKKHINKSRKKLINTKKTVLQRQQMQKEDR
jgi:hypothetical protein